MLTRLYIQHYALINHLDIDWQGGFTSLTGETGAGKSIILGALSLVMGGRADTKTISEGEEKCIIEATFQSDEELIIRRELYASGRSRSFVNDEVVSQKELSALASRLIDIHSQHENLLLKDDSFQLGIVDALADNANERDIYAQEYGRWLRVKQELQDLITTAEKSKNDRDYLEFQYRQLSDMHLAAGEEDELQQEHYRLTHAEELKTVLEETLTHLTAEQVGVLALLRGCKVGKVSESLQERIDSAGIELKDISESLQSYYNEIEVNPTRLSAVEERMMQIEELCRKHKVQTTAELLTLQATFSQQLTQIADFDTQIQSLQQAVEQQEWVLAAAAQSLTKSREAIRNKVSQQLEEDLTQLGIAHAKMDIAITPLDTYTESGKDSVQFMFAANLNQRLRPVSAVASGGEISRIMLCLKALVASVNGLPTIIFDEIDTGVGGETATQMGRIMHRMSESRQIIAITHLPQIAAHADRQYKVYKSDTENHTETHISILNEQERVREIATMISGKQVTDAALQNAQQLLCSH